MVSALERLIGRTTTRREAAVERCGLCAGRVAEEHRHLLDEQDGSVMCACTACSLLFEGATAGGDRYHLIPARRIRLGDLSTESLNVPVGLAFFVKRADATVLGHYPSPLGTTRCEIGGDAWRAVEEQSSALVEMAPRVEALLVRADTRRGAEHWIVPIDDCFRLVAVIRRHWTGMSGGSAVWRELARFFDGLGGISGQHIGHAG
jgi:hypothetical protein